MSLLGYVLLLTAALCCSAAPAPDGKCNRPDIKNGYFYYNYYFPITIGRSVEYRCEKNYISHQKAYLGSIQCTDLGWNPEPKCSRICTWLKSYVENAELIDEQYLYLEGEKVKFECKPNFLTPDGKTNGERTCLPNGEFSPAECSKEKPEVAEPPTDVNKQQEEKPEAAEPPTDVNKHQIGCAWFNSHVENAKLIYEQFWLLEGEKVKFECKPNFLTPDGKTGGERTCLPNGELTPAECSSSCLKPEIEEVEELQGDWEDDTYPEGTMATYQCRPGYSRAGRSSMICLNGKWEYVSPRGQCLKKSCWHPGDIPFGSFQLIEGDSFLFGAIVEYFCEDGYQMVSRERTRQCTDDGWSNNPPQCEIGAQCGPPPVVQHGDTIGFTKPSYNSTESVEYKCPEHYVLQGNKNVRCLNGVWEEAPVCLESCTCEQAKLQYPKCFKTEEKPEAAKPPTDINKQQEEKPEAAKPPTDINKQQEKSCGRPDDIPFGRFQLIEAHSFTFGAIVEYFCEYGYHMLSRERTRQCTDDGWSNNPPQCGTVAECGPPPVVQHGDTIGFTKPLYRSGESVEYKCPENYVLQGKRIVRCLNGVWEEAPVCLESCTCEQAKLQYPKCFKTAESSG